MPYFGIDYGATFIKGAVLDIDRMKIDHVVRFPFPDFISNLPEAFREISPEAILTATRHILGNLSAHTENPEGILLCGQMGCLVLVDDSGRALTNIVSWQDSRGDRSNAPGSTEDLVRSVSEMHLIAAGNDFRASTPLKTLFWLKANNPGLQRCVPTTLCDFIAANLTNSRVDSHRTNAAAFGCMDLNTGDWHPEVLKSLDLTDLQWPDIVSDWDRPVGVSSIGGIRIPVFPSIGDQQAALVGAGLEERELSINIGTGSQVSRLSSSFLTGDFQCRPFVDARYVCTITHIPAGRALNGLLRFLNSFGSERHISDLWQVAIDSLQAVSATDLKDRPVVFPKRLRHNWPN